MMSAERTFAAALLDPARALPSGLSTWNGSDPAPRFAVYRNNVAHSLLEALADTFPVTRRIVGTTAFQQLALVFLGENPPRSPILADYGATFPAHLELLQHVHHVPAAADVARLEFLRLQAYHAADDEPISADRLQQLLARPEILPGLRLTLHPSVRTLRSQCAVASIWAAHQTDEVEPPTPILTTVSEHALIARADGEVVVVPVHEASAVFVECLAAGQTLGAAALTVSHGYGSFDLVTSLAILIRHHAITRVADSTELPS